MKRFLKTCLHVLLFYSGTVSAAPVRHVVLDVDETLIQRNQEYTYDGSKLVPILESIEIEAAYPDGSIQKRTYYIRAGVKEYLHYLITEKQKQNLTFSVLSFSHQARLNAILSAIQIDGRSLIDECRVAFGAESVEAYYRKKFPNQSSQKAKKDLSLVVHPDAIQYWKSLRSDDLKILDSFTPGPPSVPSKIILLDDKPEYLVPEQRSQAIKIKYSARDSEFWKNYEAAAKQIIGPLDGIYERESMLYEVESERTQFRTLIQLMEEAKQVELSNDYSPWEKMLNGPRITTLERAHFKYIIPDLLKKDLATQHILILGRDSDLLFEALETLKEPLGIKSQLHYLNISRLVAKNNSAQVLLGALEKSGIDVNAVKAGKHTLRILDTGYGGTVPKLLVKAFFGDDPQWKNHAKSVSAVLMTTPSIGNSPEAFSDFDQYLKYNGFVEEPVHQFRYGHDNLREVIHHFENFRPRDIIRPSDIKNSEIVLTASHPSEARYSRVLHRCIREYFQDEQVQKGLKDRIAFVRGEQGHFPHQWQQEDEAVKEFPAPWVDDVRLRQVMTANLDRDLRLKKTSLEKYGAIEMHIVPGYVVHIRKRGEENTMWFDYQPDFLDEITREMPTVKSETKRPLYNREIAREIRQRGMLSLSRSAKGLHTADSTSKKMKNYGEALAQETVAAQVKVNEILEAALSHPFSTRESIESMILEIARTYEKTINSRSQLFRDWEYSIPDSSSISESGKSIPKHSPDKIERDWIWFTDWLQKELQTNYDPKILGSQIHYILTARLHPFYDGVGKTSRDLVDFVYMRKGYLPPDWSKISIDEYYDGIRDVVDTFNLIDRTEKNRSDLSRIPLDHCDAFLR